MKLLLLYSVIRNSRHMTPCHSRIIGQYKEHNLETAIRLTHWYIGIFSC